MDYSQSSLSLEYVIVTVATDVSPTADVVKMAFLTNPSADPQTTDFKVASWDGSQTVTPYRARCLVGPTGDAILGKGRYYIWLKITDNPEIPAKQVGVLTIY